MKEFSDLQDPLDKARSLARVYKCVFNTYTPHHYYLSTGDLENFPDNRLIDAIMDLGFIFEDFFITEDKKYYYVLFISKP